MADDGLSDPWQHPTEGMRLREPGQGALEEAARLRREHPVATTVGRLLRVHTDERAWRVGGQGEQRVGAILDQLPETDWLVLHDLVLNQRGTNVDHLVVGPPGVVTINTKHHPGGKVWVASRALYVNGNSQSRYRPAAVREAERVGAGIAQHSTVEFTVTPLLLILCQEMKIKKRPSDVAVMRGIHLRRWLLRRKAVLRGPDLWRLRHDVAAWVRTLPTD